MAIPTDPKLDNIVKQFVEAGRKSHVSKLADFTSQGYRHGSGIHRTVEAFAKYPNSPKVWQVQATETTTAYFIGNDIDEVVARFGPLVPVTHKPLSETRLIRILSQRMKAFRNEVQARVDQISGWSSSGSVDHGNRHHITYFQEILSRDLDTIPRFKQAIADADKTWPGVGRPAQQFFAESAGKYDFTPELTKKAWAFANNNPVEGLK